jgi:hypothetical protein
MPQVKNDIAGAAEPVAPADAILQALKHCNFDARVPKGRWVAVTIFAKFEDTGTMFHNITVTPAPDTVGEKKKVDEE